MAGFWKNALSTVVLAGAVSAVATSPSYAYATKCEDVGPARNVCISVDGWNRYVEKVTVSADGSDAIGYLKMRTYATLWGEDGKKFANWLAGSPEFYYTPKSLQVRSTTFCSRKWEYLQLIYERGPLCALWDPWQYASYQAITLRPTFYASNGSTIVGDPLEIEISGGIWNWIP